MMKKTYLYPEADWIACPADVITSSGSDPYAVDAQWDLGSVTVLPKH